MIRLVLAVALSLALLAVSLPVIDTVRISHADARVDGALDRVETTARTLLARNDAVRPGSEGAGRRLTLHLPVGTWATAGVERFVVRPTSLGTGTRVTWRVDGGAERTRRLTGSPIRPVHGGFVHSDGGRLDVALSLVVRDGDRFVRLRRRG